MPGAGGVGTAAYKSRHFANATGDGMSQILAVINHNRGYDNNSGEAAGTILTDISFRPLVGLQNAGPYEPFDYARAVKREWPFWRRKPG